MDFKILTYLGDSAYSTNDWLIPPFRQNARDPAEQRFNVAHKSTRRIIECAYGILKERFPCLNYLRVAPNYAAKIVMACATLHNLASVDDFMIEEGDAGDEDGANESSNGNEVRNARLRALLNFFR